MSPCKGDIPTFVDNKGQAWGTALWTKVLSSVYVYRTDINMERRISCSNVTCTWEIIFKQEQVQAIKYFQVQATKYEKLSLQVQCPVQSALQLSLSCFLLMLLTESFYIHFC